MRKKITLFVNKFCPTKKQPVSDIRKIDFPFAKLDDGRIIQYTTMCKPWEISFAEKYKRNKNLEYLGQGRVLATSEGIYRKAYRGEFFRYK